MTLAANEKRGLLDSLVTRVLHTYFILGRGLTLGVRAIVWSEDGKVLLVRHTYTPGWHFPGGGVERGETAVSALAKELLQETGLHLEGVPKLHGVFHNNAVNSRDHVLAYICQVSGRLVTKPTSLEIAEAGFFDLADLPEGTDPGTIRRLREVVDGEALQATW